MPIWSQKEDEILINFVRRHEVLYDVKHPKYRQTQLKRELWREVGEILNKTGSECYKKWCCVRDYYIRRRGKQPFVGEALKRRSKLLSFLDNYSWIKRRTTSYDQKEDTQDNNELYMIHVTEDTEDPLSDKGDSNIDTYNKSNHSEEESNHVEECDVTGSIKKNVIWNHRLAKKHNQIKIEPTPTTENDSNNSEDDCKNFEEYKGTGNKMKRKHRHAEETLNQILQSTVYKVRDPTDNIWDETDLFFSSIAKIVKKLPRYEQIELRMKIGSMVGNAELRCIGHDSPHRGSPQPSTSGNDYPEITTAGQKTSRRSTKYLEISLNE